MFFNNEEKITDKQINFRKNISSIDLMTVCEVAIVETEAYIIILARCSEN